MRLTLAAYFCSFGTVALAQGQSLPSAGIAYVYARQTMLRASYHAYRWPPSDSSDIANSNGRVTYVDPIRHRFHELAFCEGADINVCYFVYVRGKSDFVKITAQGEQPESFFVSGVEAITEQDARELYRPCHFTRSCDPPR